MRRLPLLLAVLVTIGIGCTTSAPVDVSLSDADQITFRPTVFGIGGKIAGWFGGSQEEETHAYADLVGGATVESLPATLTTQQYQELVTDGKTSVSLGLLDSSLSGALEWTDGVKSFFASVGKPLPDLPSSDDVLAVTVTKTGTTDWVRLNGTLVQANTFEASNWFASYKILANPDAPLILSLTLTPAARGDFSKTGSFGGYEVSEIVTGQK